MNLALLPVPGGEGGRAGEQRGELLHDVLHGLVEGPGGVRGHGGGDLDGDVVDVRAGQQRVGALEPAGGLVLAQDCLAEEVDVELDAVLADLGDGRAQLGVGGVHDQVAHHFAEHAAGDRDDHLRQDRGHGAAEARRRCACTRAGTPEPWGPGRRGCGRRRCRSSGRTTPSTKPTVKSRPFGSFRTPASCSAEASTGTFAASVSQWRTRAMASAGQGLGLGDVDVDRLRGGRVRCDCRFHCNVGHGFHSFFPRW